MTHYEDMMQKMTVEGMASLIARQPCTRCIWENEDCNDKSCAEGIEKWLMEEEEKEIKVQGEIHAHWEKADSLFHRRLVQCSNCGNFLDMEGVNCGRGSANYCPNCGAKMDPMDS